MADAQGVAAKVNNGPRTEGLRLKHEPTVDGLTDGVDRMRRLSKALDDERIEKQARLHHQSIERGHSVGGKFSYRPLDDQLVLELARLRLREGLIVQAYRSPDEAAQGRIEAARARSFHRPGQLRLVEQGDLIAP